MKKINAILAVLLLTGIVGLSAAHAMADLDDTSSDEVYEYPSGGDE